MTALAKQQIIDAIETGVADASNQGVPEWLAATDCLLKLFAAECQPFSSGEIAAHLRTFKPTLRFSVTSNVGEHIRERFYADTLPLFQNADGTVTPAEQVPRSTQGFSRTPPGTQVFVYAPDYQTGSDHDFEVDIPKPGATLPLENDGLPAVPVQPPSVQPHFVNLTPRKPVLDLKASVHNDARLCIARSALEALLHETQTGLKGGDSVYVGVDNVSQELVVSLDRDTGMQGYQLSASRGRVLVPHPAHPFTPGDTFKVTVDGPGRRLVVDLSATV
jgi:hypothetical protein